MGYEVSMSLSPASGSRGPDMPAAKGVITIGGDGSQVARPVEMDANQTHIAPTSELSSVAPDNIPH